MISPCNGWKTALTKYYITFPNLKPTGEIKGLPEPIGCWVMWFVEDIQILKWQLVRLERTKNPNMRGLKVVSICKAKQQATGRHMLTLQHPWTVPEAEFGVVYLHLSISHELLSSELADPPADYTLT